MTTSAPGRQLGAWMIVFTCLTSLVIGLRLWAIRMTKKSLQAADYFVLICHCSAISLAGVAAWAIMNGLGAHTDTLTLYEIGVQWQLFTAAGVAWLVGTVASKLSMLCLYLSLFRTSRRDRYMIYVCCGFVTAYYIAFQTAFLTQCRPISYGWKPVPGGSCRDGFPTEVTSISFNIVLDTAIAILPVPIISQLQMPLRTKITIGTMFLMGMSVVAIMIWRLVLTLQSGASTDFVFGLGRIALTSFLELWLSIIVVSLPTLAPLVKRYVKPLVSQRSRSGGHVRLREAQHTIGSAPAKYRGDESVEEEADTYGYSAGVKATEESSGWPSLQMNEIHVQRMVALDEESGQGHRAPR